MSGARWRIRLAYDGRPFHGFAAQPGQVTVAGALADALGHHTGFPVDFTCAARTDAGVHAADQTVHFDVPQEHAGALDPAHAVRSLNRQLAPSVVVRALEPAPDGFDARRSATARQYRYLVVNGPVADPLLAPIAWHVPDPLDLRALRAASDALLGEHDFRAFCRKVPGTTRDEPIPRRVTRTRWSDAAAPPRPSAAGGAELAPASAPFGEQPWRGVVPAVGTLLAFEIEATAFCHQMVRSIVGTLVEIGCGRRRPADVLALLRSGDRTEAGQPAPPSGLCLTGVSYPAELAWG